MSEGTEGAQGGSEGGGDGGAAAAALAGSGGGEGEGGAAAGGGAGGGTGGESGSGGDGQTWRDKWLPDDLRGNDALAAFDAAENPIAAMAKSFVDTKRMVGSRVALPKEGDEASFTAFAETLRPEKAEDYKIAVPEGQEAGLADAMRPIFHEVGLHPAQAERLVDRWNRVQADAQSRIVAGNQQEISAIELDLGPEGYAARNEAAGAALASMGIEIADLVPALEQVVGGGKALAALHTLAEKTGELAKVDGGTVAMRMGRMTSENAKSERERLSQDPEFRQKMKVAGSPERQKWNQLLELEAKGT